MMRNSRLLKKMDSFIYKFIHIIRKPLNSLKTLNEKLKQISDEDRNPYQVFRDWLLDVVVNGTILTFIVVVLFQQDYGFYGVALRVMAFGLAQWLVLEWIRQIRQAIK